MGFRDWVRNGGTQPSVRSGNGYYRAPDTDAEKRARAERERQGWYVDVPPKRPHLCFPPKAYPQQVGHFYESAHWGCESCHAVWRSEGIQLVNGYDDWPVGANRTHLALLGPQRWFLAVDGTPPKTREQLSFEEGLYDFRPLGPYYVKLWRSQLEAMGVDWKAFST